MKLNYIFIIYEYLDIFHILIECNHWFGLIKQIFC